MGDLLISSLAFFGTISAIIFVCLEFNLKSPKCPHFYATQLLIALAALAVVNLITFTVVEGTRKRIRRFNEDALMTSPTRNTMNSLDEFLAQRIETPCDVVDMINDSDRANHNYVNLIMK